MSKTVDQRTRVLRYDDSVVDAAFELYDEGQTLAAIGRNLQVSRRTLARWRDELGWAERRERNREVAGEILDQKCQDRRVELAESAQEALNHALEEAKRTKARQIDNAAKAVLDLAKALNLLVGAPTDIQEQRIATLRDLWELARGGGGPKADGPDSAESRPLPAVGSQMGPLK